MHSPFCLMNRKLTPSTLKQGGGSPSQNLIFRKKVSGVFFGASWRYSRLMIVSPRGLSIKNCDRVVMVAIRLLGCIFLREKKVYFWKIRLHTRRNLLAAAGVHLYNFCRHMTKGLSSKEAVRSGRRVPGSWLHVSERGGTDWTYQLVRRSTDHDTTTCLFIQPDQ